jgi:U3 small nucleolar RNA-associated protein 6
LKTKKQFRALQVHPNNPALYILAASHELDHLSPSAARALLQRGIRLNEGSMDMWTEYVKMELGFIESLRRRWDVLGIEVDEMGKGKAKEVNVEMEDDPHMDADVNDSDATARNEIMEGAIVKSVITSAMQGTVWIFFSLPSFNIFSHCALPLSMHLIPPHQQPFPTSISSFPYEI